MKPAKKRTLEGLLGGRYHVEKATRPEDLAALLSRLRPVKTKAPLVRIGPPGDGGYLLPDDLDGVTTCISPGVSTEAGFDLALAERGVEIHMADASVAGPPMAHPRFHFTPKFLDLMDDETRTRLDTYCAPILSSGDAVLQMDIEGAEWRVLYDASPATLQRFRIMVIEFHGLEALFGRGAFALMAPLFDKLLQTHAVVHLHPNNCDAPVQFGSFSIPPLMEITFYRRDRDFVAWGDGKAVYPHPLDADNVPGRPSVHLPECWR